MAENLGTMVIGVKADATGVAQTFASVRGQTAQLTQDISKQGNVASGTFDALRGSVGRIFSELKTGNLRGAVAEVQGLRQGFAGAGAAGVSSFTQVAAAAGAVTGAVAGIAAASRHASAEVEGLRRFSERIGSSVAEAGTLRRFFTRAGVEDPERTVSKFSDRVGDALRDREGTSADSFRQLGLSPERLASQSPVENLRDTITALGQVRDASLRASLAQATLGKEFITLQEAIRLGGQALEEAAQRERLFGPGEATIKNAADAQAKWREVGLFFQDIWDSFAAGATAAGAFVSRVFASLGAGIVRSIRGATEGAARLLLGLPKIEDVPTLGGRRQAVIQSAGLVQGERAIEQLSRRTDLEETLTSEVIARGLATANSTRQEIEANRQLLQQEEEILRTARRGGLTAAEEPAFIDRLRAQTARESRRSATKTADDVANDLFESQRFQGNRLRSVAGNLGFTAPGALAADAEAARDLVLAFDKFQRAPGRISGEVERFRVQLAGIAAERREDAAVASNDEAQRAVTTRSVVALYHEGSRQQALALAAAQEQLDLARGISATEAARTRTIAEQNDLFTRRNTILADARQPIDDFRDRFREIEEVRQRGIRNVFTNDPAILARQRSAVGNNDADLATRSAFLRLEQSVFGSLPSSFALSGVNRGSIDEARLLADTEARANLRGQDPQERVRQVMEASRELLQQQLQEARLLRQAIENQQQPEPAQD